MDSTVLLEQISLKKFLSFDEEGVDIGLGSLNVLIGMNGSGKSNFVEAVRLLQATPKDVAGVVRRGGGVEQWLWKGAKTLPVAHIATSVRYIPPEGAPDILRYALGFTATAQRLQITDESVVATHLQSTSKEGFTYYRNENGRAIASSRFDATSTPAHVHNQWMEGELRPEFVSPEQSVFSFLKDPFNYPTLTYLGEKFSKIAIYGAWNIGQNGVLRRPQPTDLPNDTLLPDGSNLGLILNKLVERNTTRQTILSHLKRLYPHIEGISVRIEGGTTQIFIEEEYTGLIPASRLSDGTLVYLCLLAILCHPSPPPLLCIEEPERGLHPDILPTVAELLKEASTRTQLIVTTHSDILISALRPEDVIVCERDENGTQLRRLETPKLSEWLKRYSLGELWLKGEIGGTRW